MQRLVGVDVTRGLAVLGMVTAHVGAASASFWSPTGWLQVADGRSAATFATLAGLSAALLSGGRAPAGSLTTPRLRIAVRAVLVGAMGIVVTALGTPIAIILPTYALLLTALLPVLGWSPRALLAVSLVPLLVGPALVVAADDAVRSGAVSWPATLVVGHYYPAAVWLTYLLVGLAVGRLDLRSARVRRGLAIAGGAALLVGYGVGAVALRLLPADATWWRAMLASSPHANAAPEVVGNLGVVLLVLVACLGAADRAPRLVAPLAATGALALTAYCGHLVAIALLGDHVVRDPSNLTLLGFLAAIVLGCTAWRARYGRGPLERLVHGASVAAAPDPGPQPAPGTPGR